MKRLFCVAVLSLLAASAFAEDAKARTKPPGTEKIDAFEQIVILGAEPKLLGPAAKLAFVKGVKDMYGVYKDLYGFDVERVSVGADGKVFKKGLDESISIVLFRDQATYDEWLGVEGTGGVTVHRSRISVIGMPLADGAVSDEVWPTLWHEMSHAFFFTSLRSGGTLWLNEGLAEYFAYANKRVDPKNLESFKGMQDRLRDAKEKKTATPVKDLMSGEGTFGRQQYDEAWVLAHLLFTEAKPALNAMLRHVRVMEDSALENPAAVMKDIHEYLSRMVELTFKPCGGAQKAWEFHRDALLKSGSMPAKLAGTPASLKDEPSFLDIDGKLVRSGSDKDGTHVLAGKIVYGLAGPGKVGFATFDKDGKVVGQTEEGATSEDCKPVKFDKVNGSLAPGGKILMYVMLESASGAKYARRKEYTVPR